MRTHACVIPQHPVAILVEGFLLHAFPWTSAPLILGEMIKKGTASHWLPVPGFMYLVNQQAYRTQIRFLDISGGYCEKKEKKIFNFSSVIFAVLQHFILHNCYSVLCTIHGDMLFISLKHLLRQLWQGYIIQFDHFMVDCFN